MEKKTIEKLRNMICEELEEISKSGKLGSHENLDVVKDLLESMKNLDKIEHYQKENEEMNYDSKDMGYSQRSMGRYYIDGQYGTGNSFNRGDMGMGNSYGWPREYGDGYGRMSYDMGNSYRYYDPRYEMGRGYSQSGQQGDVVSELHKMMNESNSDVVKKAISEALAKVETP